MTRKSSSRSISLHMSSVHQICRKKQAKKENAADGKEGSAIGALRGSQRPTSNEHPSASPLDPPGAIFEPPANARGAAPYRRIVNRQVAGGELGRCLVNKPLARFSILCLAGFAPGTTCQVSTVSPSLSRAKGFQSRAGLIVRRCGW